VERGVARFLEHVDPFYEGRYQYTVRYVPRRDTAPWSWPLWLINSGYVWAIRRHVPAGAVLLEVGCASGVAYLARRYRVIGLDLSLSSLARVAELYAACLQADITVRIPLPDASVDAVASSFVWEHVSPALKPRALGELHRVLRPGGKLVFLYDVECDNPIYRRMRRADPRLYREILIDREGHLGWQSPEENARLFRENGFRRLSERGKEKLLIGPSMYDKVQHWGGGLARLSRVGLRFRGSRFFHLYNAATRVLDETLGRGLPHSWSRVVVAVWEKDGG
jgi:SAM-dependent methyltransferase